MVLTFAVAPAYRDVRVILAHSGATLYELNATAVLDVKYRRDGTLEFVDVVLADADILTLSVKPSIRLEHRCDRQVHG